MLKKDLMMHREKGDLVTDEYYDGVSDGKEVFVGKLIEALQGKPVSQEWKEIEGIEKLYEVLGSLGVKLLWL